METFDSYNLKDDVLFKSNEDFYEFVEQVTGQVEANILRVQDIRNAQCLIRLTDLLAILELDCEEVNALKPQACFLCKTGEFIIKQGVKLNLDNLCDALKDKHERYKKKTQQHSRQQMPSSTPFTPSTISTTFTDLTNNDKSIVQESLVEVALCDPSDISLISISALSSISKYTTTIDHMVFVKDLIEKFSRKTFMSVVLKDNEHYSLMVVKDGQTFKATIKCQCGTKIMLPIRSDTATFILSNYYAHLTATNCSMVEKITKQERTSTPQFETPSASDSVSQSSISISNDIASKSGTQAKRKNLYDISCVTKLSSNKKKKLIK